MGMAAYQLAVDPGQNVAQLELTGLPGYVGMESDLDQQVAQLFGQHAGVPKVDGLQYLVGLLQQVALQRLVGLLPVPRAASGRPEPRHDVDQRLESCRVRLRSTGDCCWDLSQAWADYMEPPVASQDLLLNQDFQNQQIPTIDNLRR